MDDFVLNVRQILQYPQQITVLPTDGFLLQSGGVGGPYKWATPLSIINSAFLMGGYLNLAPEGLGGVAFNGAALTFHNGKFTFSEGAAFADVVHAPQFFVEDPRGLPYSGPVATVDYADFLFTNSVHSFNGRVGRVLLEEADILRAGGAPILNPHLLGWATSTEPFSADVDDASIATCHWVHRAFCHDLNDAAAHDGVVLSFNGRGGRVILNADDITLACTATGAQPRTNTPPFGDASTRIANTLFVDDGLAELRHYVDTELDDWTRNIVSQALLAYAPLDSPQFVGIPTAPTAAPGTTTGQLATTAYVQAAITASTTGVASFNTRTGAVVLNGTDVTNAGGALLASPHFTGVPTAPTATLGTNTTQLATTAFVLTELATVAAGVASFNTRTGAVVLTSADVTGVGGALLASPTFTGTPAAPTPTAGDNSTKIATTAFITNAIGALPSPVISFNSRVGAVTLQANDVSAVGGALLVSPAFTGNPTAPTPAPGDNDTSLATTAFVAAALAAVGTGVTSFNSRTGAITLIGADVTAAGGALLAGPTFTGVPAAPTATAGTNTTQLATTAFVQAALAAAPGGVSSFNSRTGAITLIGADVSAAGGALLASPIFTGNPTAPTPTAGDNDTSIATTAFVANAIATAGGVATFNGRAGTVTFTAADLLSVSGAIYHQADTAPATGTNQTFWYDSIHGQLYLQYVDPSTSAKSWVIANTPPTPAVAPGTRVQLQRQDVTSAVASVDFTGGVDWVNYERYEIAAYGVQFSVASALAVRTSSNAGSTWDQAAGQYAYSNVFQGSTSPTPGGSGGSQTYLPLTNSNDAVALRHVDCLTDFFQRPAGQPPAFISRAQSSSSSGGLITSSGVGWNGSNANPINGLRFIPSAGGNITAGTFIITGIAK